MSLTEETFVSTVLQYEEVNDKVGDLQKEMKSLKERHKALGKDILSYMQTQGVRKCEADRANLLISESIQQKPLTMDLLQGVFKSKFPNHPDFQKQLLESIIAARRHGGSERTRLKRVKKRQAKKAVTPKR